MYLAYQWIPGAYSHNTAIVVAKQLHIPKENILNFSTFTEVRKSINQDTLAVLPIENSRAGSIHDNLYNFLRYDYQIIGEVHTAINHVLLSKERHIEDVHTVFSHPQALNQCYNFLTQHHMQAIEYFDTAGAAKYLSDHAQAWVAAIASEQAGNLYNLHILARNIQDQDGNTTRFFVVAHKDNTLKYPDKKGKMTLLFQARDIPASLYKCLGAFATNNVNLTKIESLPSFQDPFMYTFRLEFAGTSTDENVQKSLNELTFFTRSIQRLGEY